ncbi:DUF3558 domain-containing protein [Nocardia thailandica]|uniref:DUF3558 domain-containing protein n=1 Tax=Nocardia thailandica TaxID=257275 RepID=UPI0002FDDA6B|nr:DUF3558 domain-containing protein [Nocardia thailandica]
MTALVIAGVAMTAAGCDGSGEPAAKGTTSAAGPALWNPCTEIPDASLTAAGVDPKTEEKGVGGVAQPGWEICGWTGPDYSLTVYSTNKGVDQFETKPGNVEFRDVTIAGRAGREFRVEGASKKLDCDTVFPAAQGVVQLQVLGSPLIKNPGDPCQTLATVGAVLVPTFPK